MRLAAATVALLLLTLLSPGAAAAECPALSVWATDEAGDVYDLPDNLNGGMDILELRVGQGGADCSRIVVGLTINDPLLLDPALGSGDQDPEQPFNAATQRVIVDLGSVDGEAQISVHFIWSLRTHVEETDHLGWWAELYVDGALVSDTTAGNNAKLADTTEGGTMDASIARSELKGATAWLGAVAAAHEWGHDAYHENGGPGYAADTLTVDDPFTFDYGIGAPPVASEPTGNVTIPEGNATGTSTGNETVPGGNGTGNAAGNETAPSEGDCSDDANCEGPDAAGNETVDDTPAGKESPGVALPMVLALLATVAAIRVRRR